MLKIYLAQIAERMDTHMKELIKIKQIVSTSFNYQQEEQVSKSFATFTTTLIKSEPNMQYLD